MAATFTVMRTDQLERIVLSLAGPLDAVSAPACDQAISDALAAIAPGHTLVIDLRQLDLIAAAGIRVLLGAVNAAREAGVPTEVTVAAGQYLATILDRIDVHGRLPLVEHSDRDIPLGRRR